MKYIIRQISLTLLFILFPVTIIWWAVDCKSFIQFGDWCLYGGPYENSDLAKLIRGKE